MSQVVSQKIVLYEQDLNLWLEQAIAQLKSGQLKELDIENLIEELEGLAGRDRRELKSRLTTLIEHLLKRCYVNNEYDYAGWEETIDRNRFEILNILEQSPSLKNYINDPDLFQQAFDFASRTVNKNQGYKSVKFPNSWQFSCDIDAILSVDFWEL